MAAHPMIKRNRYPIIPMDLGNMRANGVRRLAVYCWNCHHEATLDVDRYDDAVIV